nr:MAG TPA: hypothetical protein [Caudoviricetes sp.]
MNFIDAIFTSPNNMCCPHYSKKLMVGLPSATHIIWIY